MAQNSKIEWTDHTFNPWIGCQKVSPGCDNCYAETQNAHRKWNGGTWGPHAPRKRTSEANWKLPMRWAKAARGTGKRPRVFCASLADVFDNQASEDWRNDLWRLIRETPELDWLLLTKRPENIKNMLPSSWFDRHEDWQNVWLGTTCEDQKNFDRRWSILSAIAARVRFISYEPAVGPVFDISGGVMGIVPDWLICGGESGSNARMMEPKWAANVKMQCEKRKVAFFMKQMTGRAPIPDDLMLRQFPV